MKSKLTAATCVFFTLLTTFTIVYAAAFELTSIGGMDTSGKKYTEWWYSGTHPVLTGTANNNSDVKITVGTTGGTTNTVTSDSNGTWNYTLPLDKGDYDIVLTSDTFIYAFKLHLGQAMPSSTTSPSTTIVDTTTQTTTSGNPVPATGSREVAAIMMTTGLAMLAGYYYFVQTNRHKAFEKDAISDKK